MKTLIIISSLLFFNSALAAAEGPTASLAAVTGDGQVTVLHNGQETPSATIGTALTPNDVLQVPAGTAAQVTFSDGTRVSLGHGSTLKFLPVQSGAPSCQLDSGKALINVQKAKTPKADYGFFIFTRSAVSGVRGTQFTLEVADSGTTTLHTINGTVDFAKDLEKLTAGKGVSIGAGEMISADQIEIGGKKKFDRRSYMKNLVKDDPNLAVIEVKMVGSKTSEKPDMRARDKFFEKKSYKN